MDSVRVYSITVSQVANRVGVLQRIEASVIAAFDSVVAQALEAAKRGAFGGSLVKVPLA